MIKGYARGIAAAVRFGSAVLYQLHGCCDPLDRPRSSDHRLLARPLRRIIVLWICLLVISAIPGISFADDTSDPCGGTGYFQYYQIWDISNGYGCTPFACQVGEQTQSEQTAAAQCFNAAQFIHCTLGPQPSYFAQGPAGVGLMGHPRPTCVTCECAPFALLPRSTSPKLRPHRHPAPTLGSPVQSVGTVSIPSIHPPAMKPSRRPMWSRWARVTVSVSSDTTTVSIPQVRTWVQAGGTASVDISRSHPSA